MVKHRPKKLVSKLQKRPSIGHNSQWKADDYQTKQTIPIHEIRKERNARRHWLKNWRNLKKSRIKTNSRGKRKRSKSNLSKSLHQIKPWIRFVEKHNGEDYHLNGAKEHVSNYFQFALQDGRVDVPQVLTHLGLTKLQYESQPGVWRALKSHSTGKSINRFQNQQEFYFRGDARSSRYKVREDIPWVDDWLIEGDTEETYNARVSRIVQRTPKGRIGVGTMVRVRSSFIPGLMITCRHCVELGESGSINDKLQAFGGPIKILYVSEKYDLALCDGPLGSVPGFRLAEEGEEEKGREVRMLSYPWHVDLVYGLHENVGPTQVHGHICMFSSQDGDMPMEVDVLATYMGGFPASSGGAVTLNSKVLCGIHVGVIWHDKDELSVPLVLGSAASDGIERKDTQPHTSGNAFHMQLCGRQRNLKAEAGVEDCQATTDNGHAFRSQIRRNYCSSSHGYLATYVSSSHIEEAFQDYIKSTNDSRS